MQITYQGIYHSDQCFKYSPKFQKIESVVRWLKEQKPPSTKIEQEEDFVKRYRKHNK